MPHVSLDFKDFCRSGILASIPWGITREALLERLGPPDATGVSFRKDKHPTIFLYGNIEFYVDPHLNRFYAIHWDADMCPESNAGLQVDPWIIEQGISQERAEDALDEAGIPFSQGAGQAHIVTSSGVEMIFIAEEHNFSPPVGLAAISCWRSELLDKGEDA